MVANRNDNLFKCHNVLEAYELVARLDEIYCNNEESRKSKIKNERGYRFPFELAVSKRHETHKKADHVWAYNYEQEIKGRSISQWICTNNDKSDYDINKAMLGNEWQKKRT